MQTHPTFGQLVKHARREAGLTQEALAARTGVSTRAISDLERDVSRAPRAGTLQLLVGALSLSVQEREHFEAVARASQASAPTEALGPASRTPLIGRAAEFEIVDRHLAGEGPPLLVIEGEPGIGKTRLLDEAVAGAGRRGFTLLRGAVPVSTPPMSSDPVIDALRQVVATRSPVLLRRDLQGCAWLVRLLPELASGPIEPLPPVDVSREQESALIARDVVRFLANIASPKGLLLTLDNLHGADATALELLAKLVQSAGEVPLRIVAAYRDSGCTRGTALASVLGSLAHEQRVTHIRVGPLSQRDSRNLLMRVGGHQRLNAATVTRALRDTGGVPFYVVAWALDPSLEHGDPPTDHVPWPIRQSVRSRAGAPAVSSVLEAMAVAGGRASYPLLVAVCARPESEVLAALEAAMCERLVEEDGPAYRFAYGVVRGAVEADLSHTRRVLLRKRLTAALSRTVPDAQVELARAAPSLSLTEERGYHLAVLRRHRGRASAPKRQPPGG